MQGFPEYGMEFLGCMCKSEMSGPMAVVFIFPEELSN